MPGLCVASIKLLKGAHQIDQELRDERQGQNLIKYTKDGGLALGVQGRSGMLLLASFWTTV